MSLTLHTNSITDTDINYGTNTDTLKTSTVYYNVH